MATATDDPVVIVGSARTAMGAFQGIFKDLPAPALGAAAIRAALERAGVAPADVDEVLMGCVLTAGVGQAPARQAALAAGLPTAVPCTTVGKVCGSGMKTVMLAHDQLLAGSATVVVAGGMENMSRAPYLLEKARSGYRQGHGQLIDHMWFDGLEDAYEKGNLMGVFAERCAEHFAFAREAQDDYALRSLDRAMAALKSGAFREEITAVSVGQEALVLDEQPQKVKPERVRSLKAAFQASGTVTAANASSISDGAAALVLMRQSEAARRGLKPRAVIRAHATHARAPAWFTTAPVGAIQQLLERVQWDTNDVDLYEINEAFAVVAMAAIQELDLDADRVNVNGGACALGHPIGASGARLMVTLLHALEQRGLQRGVASLCIGGGEATAIAMECCV